MQHALIEHLTEADYLAGEALSPIKHEYVAGEVFAMAGASKTHGILAGNLFISLRQHLRGKPCGTWMADMKVRIEACHTYYYPDVVVTCDERDLTTDAPQDFLQYPKLVAEVLSDSTEALDRREKLLTYRQLESLEEYLLIDQKRRWVEVYRRRGDLWVHDIYEAGETLHLASVDLNLPLDELYADSGMA